ncbi:MAG: caspase family protein [Hyphomonadaceae bacterium]|nr:caspase family protein [Hyphomonadaceae bacterium]
MTLAARAAALFLLLCAFAAPAAAQQPDRRIALVIGNGAYAAQSVLPNPRADAQLVSDTLRRVGFTVYQHTDLRRGAMERALQEFGREADNSTAAMIYFAGHGLEVNGVNWLLPVDARLVDERDLEFEAISLDAMLRTLSGAPGLRMVVLDACRNNPLTRSMRRSVGATRSLSSGLAAIEVTGTLVVYSARAGKTALDGAGVNSPFASAFARRVVEPGRDAQLVMRGVSADVRALTDGAQEPAVFGDLPGTDVYLVPGAAQTVSASEVEAAVWRTTVATGSREAFETYLRQYPNGAYKALAQQNIARLRQPQRGIRFTEKPVTGAGQ